MFTSGLFRPRWTVALLVAATLGCAPDTTKPGASKNADSDLGTSEAPPQVNKELRGKIQVDGSSTVYPISEAAASEFRARYPNVSVTVGNSGSGTGFDRLVKGEIDIADASRPMNQEEFTTAEKNGHPFIELPIAYDGLTIVVHKQNDWVDHLTVDELKKIFTAKGAAKRWSDVRPTWPKETIEIFAPGTASGTFDYFKEVIAGDKGQLRSDMSLSEDDNVLVTGVAGSPNAIGFFGVAYYEENTDKLSAVPIVNPDTGQTISPTAQTIESGEYAPFSRPLFVYVAANSLKRPDIKRFVDFYLEHAPQLASNTGYVALPEGVYDAAMKNFRSRNTGTHYITEDGEKRLGPVTEVYQDANRRSF